jgi:hypothetical protein
MTPIYDKPRWVFTFTWPIAERVKWALPTFFPDHP